MSTDLENNSYVYPCLELRSCQFPFENNSAVSGYMSVGFAPLDFRRKEDVNQSPALSLFLL